MMEFIALGNGTMVLLERISALRDCGTSAQVLVDSVWIDSAAPLSKLIDSINEALERRGA